MKKARTGRWLAAAFRPSLVFVGASAFVVGLLWFQLHSLLPGFSEPEMVAQGGSATFKALLNNPLWLPHKVLQFGFQYFDHHGPLAMRSVSVLFGLIVVWAFYYVMSSWFSRRVAFLGTFLFMTSSWFLFTARLGTPAITYTLLFVSIACAVWLQSSRASTLSVLASALLVLSLLYIPGLIWFVIPALIWQSQRVIRFLSRQPPLLLVLLTLGSLVALTPLAYGFYRDPHLIRTYLGLPEHFKPLLEMLKDMARVPLQIFIRSPHNPVLWLGTLPLLGWFGTIMFIIGLYAYLTKYGLDRTWLIVYVGVLGTVLVGLGGPVSVSILLPFVYLVIASGMTFLLKQWFTVFPLNPVARTIGASLMTIAVLMASYYHVTRYFIAWPNTPETRQAFQVKEEKPTLR
jgi:hypothetical protein